MINKAYYKRIKLRDEDKFTSFINKFNWWKFVLAIGLLVLFIPFFPRRYGRGYPATEHNYFQQVTNAAIAIGVILLIMIWVLIIKPYLNNKRGYNLRGQFEVTLKINFFGRRCLKLQPGIIHFVKTDSQFYKFINNGDKVLIERRALGDLIKVRKI